MSGQASVRPVNVVVSEFNDVIGWFIQKLVGKLRSQQDAANLECLRRRLKVLRSAGGDEVLVEKSYRFFISLSEDILDRALYDSLILTTNIEQQCAKRGISITDEDRFALQLIHAIRAQYGQMSTTEKDEIYRKANTLLACAFEYSITKPNQ